MTTTSTRERTLTPPEKDERTQVLLALLDERDTIRLRVRASRDELRQWRVEARNLEAQIDDVRSEIRTGIVTEPAQMTLPNTEPVTKGAPTPGITPAYECCECLGTMQECELNGSLQWVCPKCDHPDIVKQAGIDGSSDEPDEATDPPRPGPYRMFELNYPAAKDTKGLLLALRDALTEDELAKLDEKTVRSWHPSSGIFYAVARWAQIFNAHRVHQDRAPTPGVVLPAQPDWPVALLQALAPSQPKKPAKAGKKKRVRKVAA